MLVPVEDKGMKTQGAKPVLDEWTADLRAVADAVAAGRPVDAAVARRVRAQSQQAQAELVKQFGVRAMAVDLVRQGRDE